MRTLVNHEEGSVPDLEAQKATCPWRKSERESQRLVQSFILLTFTVCPFSCMSIVMSVD